LGDCPEALLRAQPGGVSTKTVVVVDISETPDAFSSMTSYWPAGCFIDSAGKRRRNKRRKLNKTNGKWATWVQHVMALGQSAPPPAASANAASEPLSLHQLNNLIAPIA
jgi:hypothetical protein